MLNERHPFAGDPEFAMPLQSQPVNMTSVRAELKLENSSGSAGRKALVAVGVGDTGSSPCYSGGL